MGAHLPLHQPPEQQREQQYQSQGFNAFGLLQEETIDNDRIFEKPVVLLRPMLLFIDGEDLPSTMGHVSRRGHIGEQDEAARLFLHTTDALGVWSYGCLQPIA